jgi:hypothetical protein
MKSKFQMLLTAVIGLTVIGSAMAATLSDDDKQFLTTYEKIHAALAADDLAAAKSAASGLGDDGQAIVQANSLKEARSGFEKLSARAETMVAGQSGYHAFHCPMLNKDWVQTSTKVANPYGGKAMVACGEMRK